MTVDAKFKIAQAVAIRDGKFIAVGRDEDIKAYAGKKTAIIDLTKRPVTPGIIDSHTHPVGVGRNLLADVQISDVTCLKDIFDRLANAQATATSGKWLTTTASWYVGQVERRPKLDELDAVTPKNPLWLPLGAYEGFMNSVGIKLAGINKDTPNPPGGIVYKDEKTGEPTGHLRGTAMKPIKDLLPPIEPPSGLRKAVQYYNSIGVTAVCSEGLDYYFHRALEAYQLLKYSGELNIRCVLTLGISEGMSKEEIFGMTRALSCSGLPRGGLGDNLLKVIGLKTVDENTATGEPLWPRELLRDVLLEAAKNKVSVRIHAVCAGVGDILDLYREVNRQHPITDLRWAVVHMHMQTPEFIKTAKELGLVIQHDLGFAFIGVGPKTWYGEIHGAPKHPGRLIAPVPLYLKEGIPFSLNSDAGGANNQLSVWVSAYVACNRKKWPGWGDEYGISREDALRAVTIGGAFRLGMENKIGSVEVGKLADLAVLSENPLTCEPEKIRDIRAEMTILNGQIVYEAN
ncbi:MAG: amidohydrolase family protein [Deltaproteobacteria bacterium]|nr:amidohydrolase family protein [Deltaproteobacteria bacterium]